MLNLVSLRNRRIPDLPEVSGALQEILETLAPMPFTRRKALYIGGAVTVSPALLHALDLPRNAFTIEGDEHRLAFRVRDRDAWIIEPERFSGRPHLEIRQNATSICLRLRDAFFPGTDVPASFEADIRYSGQGWRYRMCLDFAQWEAEGPFVGWLLGTKKATAYRTLDSRICWISDRASIELNGIAALSFDPCWRMRIEGRGVAKARGFTNVLRSNSATVALLDASQPSILKETPAKRTLITLAREKRRWRIDPPQSTQGWKIELGEENYSSVKAELGETENGPVGAMIADSLDSVRASFLPAPHLRSSSGELFAFPIMRPRHAISAGPDGAESAFLANFAPQPAWIHGDGLSAHLAGGASPLEIVAVGDAPATVRAEPALLQISLPLAEGTVSALQFRGVPLPFAWDGQEQGPILNLATPTPNLCLQLDADATLHLIRSEDLLCLNFEFRDMALESHLGRLRLVRSDNNKKDPDSHPALMIVHFPAQHIAEEAFLETSATSCVATPPAPAGGMVCPGPPPVQARLACESRLVFEFVPDGHDDFDLSLKTLLDWSGRKLRVDQRAAPAESPLMDHPPAVQAPGADQTSLEVPYRMMLSPNSFGTFVNALDPCTSQEGRTELWHTRMAVRTATGVDESAATHKTLRALWSPDAKTKATDAPPTGNGPFLMSLAPSDRNEIVHLTSDYGIISNLTDSSGHLKPYVPQPVQVEQLMLTSLGATMRTKGTWNPPVFPTQVPPPANLGLSIIHWRHIVALARENYVRLVVKGYLYPFGHGAVLIKVTERKFYRGMDASNPLKPIAYLRQREFIAIREPLKYFPAVGQMNLGRALGLKSIHITTAVTPALDQIANLPGVPVIRKAFVPAVVNAPFAFAFDVIDSNGNQVSTTMPMVFVDNVVGENDNFLDLVKTDWENLVKNDARFRAKLNGQRLALAPGQKPGETEQVVDEIRFTGESYQGRGGPTAQDVRNLLNNADQPYFYPLTQRAAIRLPALQQLANNNGSVDVGLDPTYVQSGFDPSANRGEVYLAFANKLALSFGPQGNGDKVGGVITPSANIFGLSRKIGLVGGTPPPTPPANTDSITPQGLDQIRRGNFNGQDFFGALKETKILGGIQLWDVLEPLATGALDNLGDAPAALSQTVYDLADATIDLEQKIGPALDQLPALLQTHFQTQIAQVKATLAQLKTAQANKDLNQELTLQAQLVGNLLAVADGIRTLVQNPGQLAQDALQPLLAQLTNGGVAAQIAQTFILATAAQLNTIQQGIDNAVAVAEGLLNTAIAQATNPSSTIGLAVARLQTLATTLVAHQKDIDNAIALASAAVTAVSTGNFAKLADLAASQAGLTSQLRVTAAALTRLAELAGLNNSSSMVVRTALTTFLNVPQPTNADWQALTNALPGVATAVQNQALAVESSLQNLSAAGAVTLANASTFMDRHRQLVVAVRDFHNLAQCNLASSPEATRAVAGVIRGWLQNTTLFRDAQAKVAALSAMANQLKAAAGTTETQASAQLTSAATAAINAAVQWGTAISGQIDTIEVEKVYSSALAFLDAVDQMRDPLEIAVYIFGLSSQDRAKIQAWTPTAVALVNVARSSAQPMARANQILQTFLQSPADAFLKSYLTTLSAPLTTKLQALQADLTQQSLDFILRIEQEASTALQTFVTTLLGNLGPKIDDLTNLLASAQNLEDLARLFIPNSVTLSYQWNPKLKSFPSGNPIFEVDSTTKLTILAKLTVSLKGDPPSYDLTGNLTNFKVNLIADPTFITVDLQSLSFESKAGQKPTFDVAIRGVILSDQLGFVKQLEKLFNPSSGPFLQLVENGVLAGYRFGVPAFTLGAFNVQGLRLEISVNLPFTGEPMRLQLSVSDRDHPFLLSSGIFGGGGFFGMRLGLDGVELLEGALEFGAVAAINIGVASGSGYILAGIYFAVEHTSSTVSGFVRAGGEMDILGLMSMSLHIEIDISYHSDTGAVEGTAEVDVEISILFASITVHLSQHYQFAGSPGQNASMATAHRDVLALSLPATGVPAVRGLAFAPPTGRSAKGLADPDKFHAYRKKFAW